ncbi:MAG: copper amine oxidase N-terminal domain-containing protein [Clostridia bacterium]|nr:copper amine oxidase N-terminal domain-containing protein [Clostridia bacterium]
MKKILSIILATMMLFTATAFAEEYSESANVDYGYDESYDETEKQDEITIGASDDIHTSYDEDYDESGTQDISSGKYDDVSQSYNKEFDESVTNAETPTYSQPNGITVILNGKQLEFDVEPMLINSRTMVPIRVIFEALGAKVDWDGTTQTAIGVTKSTTIKITIGKDYLLKNDNIVVLDSPAVVISGRTLVPVRAIAESLDCAVNWYGETQVVEILN